MEQHRGELQREGGQGAHGARTGAHACCRLAPACRQVADKVGWRAQNICFTSLALPSAACLYLLRRLLLGGGLLRLGSRRQLPGLAVRHQLHRRGHAPGLFQQASRPVSWGAGSGFQRGRFACRTDVTIALTSNLNCNMSRRIPARQLSPWDTPPGKQPHRRLRLLLQLQRVLGGQQLLKLAATLGGRRRHSRESWRAAAGEQQCRQRCRRRPLRNSRLLLAALNRGVDRGSECANKANQRAWAAQRACRRARRPAVQTLCSAPWRPSFPLTWPLHAPPKRCVGRCGPQRAPTAPAGPRCCGERPASLWAPREACHGWQSD